MWINNAAMFKHKDTGSHCHRKPQRLACHSWRDRSFFLLWKMFLWRTKQGEKSNCYRILDGHFNLLLICKCCSLEPLLKIFFSPLSSYLKIVLFSQRSFLLESKRNTVFYTTFPRPSCWHHFHLKLCGVYWTTFVKHSRVDFLFKDLL